MYYLLFIAFIYLNNLFFMESNSNFTKALKVHINKDGRQFGTGEIKYKNAENKVIDCEFEESIVNKNSDDYKFDCFIEALQEIIIDDSYEKMQNDFCEKYYKEFEDVAENKLIYTDRFKEYTKIAETFLESELKRRVSQYPLNDFYNMLESKKFKIDEQILDSLLSISDFQYFKEMMLNYKRSKSDKTDILLTGLSGEKLPTNNQGVELDTFDLLKKEFVSKRKK